MRLWANSLYTPMAPLSIVLRAIFAAIWLTAGVSAGVSCAQAAGAPAMQSGAWSKDHGHHEQHCSVECVAKASSSTSVRLTPQQSDEVALPPVIPVVAPLAIGRIIAFPAERSYDPPPESRALLQGLATVRLLI